MLLEKIVKQLEKINANIELLTEQNSRLLQTLEDKNKGNPVQQADIMTLLQLPTSVRKTAMTLLGCNKATADDIAKMTGRSRPVESDCANQLVRMGLARKKREVMAVYFSIEPSMGSME